jgi:general secretion pathway protein A
MYSDYWGLIKPPFDNVPDASMYVDCHESMENVIAETIYAIKEGNECLTVIVGEVGLGKTLSVRVIIDSLEPERYKVALITNPALSFTQLMKEIIGQITGKQCDLKSKVDLQEMFNRLLFETADQGKKIVIVIDEANVLSPSNLDDLRLLTNMQDDERNLFTLLLVGQMEFARTLEHPKRANLFQRIGTYGHLEKLPSEESVKTYIESRLQIAGAQRKIFDDDAIPVIWEFSEHGVPRLINKICKLCLKAGETNEFETISGEVAVQIADRFQKLSKTSLQKRKPMGHADEEVSEETSKVKSPAAAIPPPREEARPIPPRRVLPEQPSMEKPLPPREEARPIPPRRVIPEQPSMEKPLPPREEARPIPPRRVMPEQLPEEKPLPPQWEEPRPIPPRRVMPEQLPEEKPLPPQWEEPRPIPPRRVMPEQPIEEKPLPPQWEEARPIPPRRVIPEQHPEEKPLPPQWEEARPVGPQTTSMAKPSRNYVPVPGAPPLARTAASNISPQREETKPAGPRMAMPQQPSPVPPQREARPAEPPQKEMEAPPAQEENEVYEDILVGKQKIPLAIPANVIKQAQSASNENKNKLAGYWSAQILKGNPQMMHSSMSDPVAVWFEVKNIILKKFNSASN